MAVTQVPTPIPIDTTRMATTATFECFTPSAWRTSRSDKRDYSRRLVSCDVWLVDPSGSSVVRAKTDDISDAGLFATAPVGYGLNIGQRYEVRIASRPDAALLSPHMGASLGYGTIVRKQFPARRHGPDRVGFAIRLDVPHLMPV